MICKVILGTTGVLVSSWTALSLVSTPFSNKLDRNVLKPIRNYR